MRIGFDGTPLLYTHSGVRTYVEQLLRHLVSAHPQWDYLLYSNRRFTHHDINGVTPLAGYFPASRWVWEQFTLPRIIAQSEADLCHFMNNSAPWTCGVPYVLTIHDASLFLFSQYHPLSRLLALRLMLPHAARRAQAIITVSHTARHELIDILNLSPEKVHVVYNAVGDHFHPRQDKAQRDQLRRQYNLPSKFILYVGTIEPRKNLRRLIAAFGQIHTTHPDCHLVMVGPSGWLINGMLEKEVEAVNLTDKVHYLGIVSQDDLPGIYSLATLFAFPSLHEGFGMPLLEAMACGTPTLTSDRSAMPEICGTAAYLVDPVSIEAIADGLNCLLNSAAQRAWHVEQGFKRVRQFSWEQSARETSMIYEKILAEHS
jgi:glycosyltransferase involved in cell wall biosynthesis